jgi:hypothetical protein
VYGIYWGRGGGLDWCRGEIFFSLRLWDGDLRD